MLKNHCPLHEVGPYSTGDCEEAHRKQREKEREMGMTCDTDPWLGSNKGLQYSYTLPIQPPGHTICAHVQ